MIIEIEGEVYRVGKTKKAGQNFCNILVPRSDGQRDSVTIFTPKEYKAGQKFKGKIQVYVQMASEVVT